MKKMLTALLAAAVAGALFIAAPLVAAPPGTEDYNQSAPHQATGCGDGNSLTLNVPEKLWPPNHKYFEDVYALAIGSDGEAITLETIGTHDQYVEGTAEEQNGAGNTSRDIYVSDDDADWVQTNEDSADPQVVAIESNFSEGVEPSGDRVQTDWQVRAERSGRDETKAGRTYTLTANAQFEDGECSISRDMNVPHDMRPSNR